MQKIATKLTARVAEFVNEVSGFDYKESINSFFHYPSLFSKSDFNGGDHLMGFVSKNYTEVTEQEFIDLITEELNPKPMTKCIVLGQDNEPVKELKKIEFVKHITANGLAYTNSKPYYYQNIELVSKNYLAGLDLIFAYNNRRDHGSAFFGHWNDGIV